MMSNLQLDSAEVKKTVRTLHLRIGERFPESGLASVCKALCDIAAETAQTIAWIQKPNHVSRGLIWLLIAVTVSLLIITLSHVRVVTTGLNVAEFVQMIEAGINEIVLITAGIISIITLDNRRKRRRVIPPSTGYATLPTSLTRTS